MPDTGPITSFSDYQTLGVDDNGVYLAVRIFPSTGSSTATIAAMQKSSLLSGTAATVTFFPSITDMFSTPQPAHNFDSIGAGDPAWFVASSRFLNDGDIYYRKLTWSGGVPSLDGSAASINSSSIASPILAPASGSTTDVNVGDVRLLMSVIRNNRLWTSRNGGLNSSGTVTGPDRTGCEWFEINVASGTPTSVQSGRVYDSAASNPRFYYFPAIMVNGQGHAAMGFSGSKSNEFVSAYFTGRLVDDSTGTMGVVELLKAGEASYTQLDGANPPRNRWGDYTYSTLDPTDDMTLWTIQEYAASGVANNWATWNSELHSPAPTLTATTASGFQGPGTYPISVIVRDDGAPSLSATNTFTATVDEVNTAPTLAVIPDATVDPGTSLSITLFATDSDVPGDGVSYGFAATPPTGAAIDAVTGELTWKPSFDQASSSYPIEVKVTDDGVPPLANTAAFTITVNTPAAVTLTLASPAAAVPVQLNAVVNPGLTYAFQASSNLIQWESLWQFEAARTPVLLNDPDSSALGLRFYRIQIVR